MTLVDRKTFTRARRTRGGGHPQRPAAPGRRDLDSQAQARQATRGGPITKQDPIGPPEVAGRMGQPAPEREPPDFGWLVLLGAVFGVAVLKESLGRIGRPVVGTVKSVPRLPAPFWTALVMGTLGRIGARVLGLRSGL